jgi:hypothetical protein
MNRKRYIFSKNLNAENIKYAEDLKAKALKGDEEALCKLIKWARSELYDEIEYNNNTW